jgi:hypothetical protein
MIDFINKKKMFLIERIQNHINVRFNDPEVNKYVKGKSRTLEHYKKLTIKTVSDVMLMSIRKINVKFPSDEIIKRKSIIHTYQTQQNESDRSQCLKTLATERIKLNNFNIDNIFTEASKIRGYKSLIKPLSHCTYDSNVLTIDRVYNFDKTNINFRSLMTLNILPNKPKMSHITIN